MLSGKAINKCLRSHNWIISTWDRTEPALTPSCGWYTSMDLTDYWWLVSHTLLVGFMRPTPWSYTSGHKQPMDINWRYLGIDWTMFTGETVIVWFMYWPTHWSYRFTMARRRGKARATMTIPWGATGLGKLVTLVVANGFDVYLWSSMVACSTFWRFLLVSVRVVISDQWLLLPFPAYQLLWTIVNSYDLLLALLAWSWQLLMVINSLYPFLVGRGSYRRIERDELHYFIRRRNKSSSEQSWPSTTENYHQPR